MQVSHAAREGHSQVLPADVRQHAWKEKSQVEKHLNIHSSGFSGAQCQDIKEAYLRNVLDSVRWWSIRFCVLRSVFAIVHATVLMLCVPGSRSQIAVASAVACAYFLMICSCLWVKKYASTLAVGICCVFILTEPLLDRHRVSWLLHTHPVQLPMRRGIQFPMDDTMFVLQMLVTVVPFLLLIPVRVRIAWIVPVMLPLVYISSTLPLAHHGVENGIINSLSVGVLLSILGVLLMVVAARMEASSHEIFNLRSAQSMADKRMEVTSTGMQTSADQSSSDSTSQTASIYQQRSSSSRSQTSFVYSDSEPCTLLSPFATIPTPESGSEALLPTRNERAELNAELYATQNELAELKAKLCATQYVSQLNCFCAKSIFQKHAEQMQKRHWLNTRAVVQRMTKAPSISRSGSAGRRSQSLPPSRQVQIQSVQSDISSQSHQGVPSASSCVQRLRDVSSTPQSQSGHITNEGLRFSHPTRECNVRNTVSQASSCSSLGACSSSGNRSPHCTPQGSRNDSEARTCESMCLDGEWEIICDDPDVETWLQRFTIQGAAVQDGVGQVGSLTMNQKNQMCFEGGALVLERGVLQRIGRSGKIVSFRRCRRNRGPE